MDRHVVVLQERIEPLPLERRGGEERLEGIVVNHHQEEEEHLHDGDGGDDPRHQQALALAIQMHRDAAEHGEQRDPEHDRPVEAAPVRRQLVEERLRLVRVVLDVLDAVVADDERVDHHGRGDEHQRRHRMEEARAAFDERALAAARARQGGGKRAARDDERREDEERAEVGHGLTGSPEPATYFEGHFAVTPPGATSNPCGLRRPVSTTSAPSLKVSGTMPL